MTKKDINNIISIICPNDEDFEKPIISPAYLKKELEALALEQEPCEDVISRQAVEDALYEYSENNDVSYNLIITEYIDTIPSVNPQIKMRDATPEERESVDKYVKSISRPTGVDFWNLEQEPSGDLISRQAVIDLIKSGISTDTESDIEYVCGIINELSPVNPQEPKTGHWIGIDEEPHEDYECDNCGFIHTFIDGHTAQYNYCPNCGARMRREDKE